MGKPQNATARAAFRQSVRPRKAFRSARAVRALDGRLASPRRIVSGERLGTKYALVNDTRRSHRRCRQVPAELFRHRQAGMEVADSRSGRDEQRGALQTTLDPSSASPARDAREAGEAERMFSVLMGEDVERAGSLSRPRAE